MSKATEPVTPRTRLQVLDPFIAELHDALGQPAGQGPGGETICLRVSGRELAVDAWTSERLDPRFPGDNPLLADCCCVVTQSVALLAKCARDLEELEAQSAGSTGALYGARAELMLDAAIGGSLVRDVQAIIDHLLKSGRVEEAGHLSKFHHQLRNTVYELRKQVTPEYRSTVETLAEQLSEAPPEAEREEAAPEPAPPKPPAPREQAAPVRRRPLPGAPVAPAVTRSPITPVTQEELRELIEPEPARRGPSRVAALALVLMVATLCLIAARRTGTMPERRGVAAETAEPAFESVVLLVEHRAPDLHVTADASAWRQLSEESRIELMRQLTGGPEAARYEEVLVQDAEGRSLMRWTVPAKEPPPDSRAKAKGRRAAPRPAESPGDTAARNLERALAVPGKRRAQADAQSD